MTIKSPNLARRVFLSISICFFAILALIAGGVSASKKPAKENPKAARTTAAVKSARLESAALPPPAPTPNSQFIFITTGNGRDEAIKYVNSSDTTASNFATGGPTGTNTGLTAPITVQVDTAAGIYFIIDPEFTNGTIDGRVREGHLATPTATPTTVYSVPDPAPPNAFGEAHAIAIDDINHVVYLGQTVYNSSLSGLDGKTGIVALSYDPTNGNVTGPSFILTRTAQSGGLGTDGSLAEIRGLALDSTNHVLYFTDDTFGKGSAVGITPTNVVKSFNLITHVETTLTSAAQFPSGSDNNVEYPTPYTNGTLFAVAPDPTDNLVFFTTADGFPPPPSGNGNSVHSKIYIANPDGSGQRILTEAAAFDALPAFNLTYDDAYHQLFVSYESPGQTSPVNNLGHVVRYDVTDGAGHTTGITAANLTLTNATDFGLNLSGDGGSPLTTATYPLGGFVDDLPLLTTSGTSTHAVEQSTNVTLLTASPTITDTDGDHLASATVQITGGTFSSNENSTADDHLTIISANRTGSDTSGTINSTSISYSYDSATEKLTLSGYDTLANYQTALSYVQYFATGKNPTNYDSNTTRTITWQVNDGAVGNPGGVNQTTTTVNIDAVDDPPVNNLPASPSINEDTLITITGLTITDVDADPVTHNIQVAFSVSHGTLTLNTSVAGGIVAGDITGGASGTNTITVTATQNKINTTLGNATGLRYQGNTNFNTGFGAENLHIVTSDLGHTGSGGPLGDSDDLSITVNAVNDPPNLQPHTTSAVSYTENAVPTSLFAGEAIDSPLADVDQSANYTGGSVTLSISGSVTGDRLSLITGAFHLAGTNVLNGGNTTIGTISGNQTVTVSVLLNSAATPATVDALLASFGFDSTSDNPTNADRTVTLTFNDGGNTGSGGAKTDAITQIVHVTPVNDPPVAGGAGNTVTYTENASPVNIAPVFTVTDPDNLNLAGATVQVTSGGFAGDGDRLAVNGVSNGTISISPGNTVTISYDPTTETITLSGSDTLAHYQTLLELTSFRSTSDNPDNFGANPTRTVTWILNDGSASNNLSTPVTSTINIVAVNDAPVFSGSAGAGFTEGGSAAQVATGVAASDVDSNNYSNGSLSVAITAGSQTGDSLAIANTGGISVSGANVTFNPGSGALLIGTIAVSNPTSITVSLNSNADDAAVVALAQAFTFSNNTQDPTNTARTATFVLIDGGGTANFGHDTTSFAVSVAVTGVNNAPTVSAPASYTGPPSTPIAINSITVGDVDAEGSTELMTFTVPSGAFTASSSGGVTITGSGTGTLTATGTITNLNSFTSANKITFTGTQSTTLNVTIDDQGHTPAPSMSANTSAPINVCVASVAVTNTQDSGAGSLRQALLDVCDGGTISFDTAAGQAFDPATAPHTITLTSGQLAITKSVTIIGPGARQLTISGNNANRVLGIGSGVTASISSLTMTAGNDAGGGIVNNDGNLTLSSCAVTAGNSSASGGGVVNTNSLTIADSAITNNTAASDGGGVWNQGALTIRNSTISNNTTTTGDGGGVWSNSDPRNVNFTNVTVSANTAAGKGGGLVTRTDLFNIVNTIVAGNSDNGSGPDAFADTPVNPSATFTSLGHNLVGKSDGSVGFNGPGDQTGTIATPLDPHLGPLADNGGFTQTHKLLPGSTAIDAGDNAAAGAAGLVADQRGAAFPRIADSADADAIATVDIGAYEAHPTIEDITDKTTAEDTPFNFNFNIGDSTGALINSVTATSDNQALIPDGNLSVTGSGPARNLAIMPAPNANTPANGTATITVTVTATNGQVATDTFVVNVTDVNDPPNVNGETIGNIAEDCAAGCAAGKYVIPFSTLLANDNAGPADESGQLITITNVGSAVGGSVVINGTNVEFTPTADFNGAASFQYTVTDNGTSSGSPDPKSAAGTASFTITEVNDPPVATDDSFAGISEDCASGCTAGKYVIPFATLTANDSKGPANESGQTLTITLVDNAVGGSVAINGTNVEFTPAANFNGAGSFDYTVQDNGTTNGANDFKTAVGHVTFPIAPIADTPTATPNPGSTNEDTQTSGIVIDRNAADGNEVAFFQILNITNGSLFQNDGTTPITNNSFITYAQGHAGLKFTPSPNFFGVSSFQLKGSIDGSGTGLSSALTVTINVSAVADVPTITPTTTNEDTQSTSGLVITRNAADGAEVTHFKITNIQNGTLFQNNGTTQINNGDFITVAQGGAGLKFTPNANLYGPVSTFTFSAAGATDNAGDGLGTAAVASITVNAVADSPSVTPNPAATGISTQTGPMVINRNAADSAEVTHFKITNITNGTLYQNDGTTAIANNQFITFAQGSSGLKFTPTAGLSSPPNNFGFDVQSSLNNTNGGLGPDPAVHENIIVSCSDPQVVTSILDDGSAGTLRYAIANSCAGTGTISFNLPAGPQTITLGSSLTISVTLSIIGPSNQSVTINGNGNRVFNVTGGSPTISNLTFNGALVSGGNGGGLLNNGTGTITFSGVTFNGNSADNGGAIATTAGTIVIINSTVSGNTGTTDGGGIYVNGGTVTLLNDTITNNTATAGQGGGLRSVSGTVNVKNTIIAGNSAAANADVAGAINDQGNNILTGNPQLAALANNGGPTMTHALLANSPALDAGDNMAAASLVTDQRGNTFGRFRDAANDADTTQTVDIGSFEADPSVEDISDKTTNEDTALPTFSFRVADTFSAFDSIAGKSNNQTIVPDANIIISGSGNSRNMDITPAANQSGTVTITVTVTKTINSTPLSMSDTFQLTINPVGDTPNVTNATTNEDTQSTSGLVITRNAVDGAEIADFKITNITGGTLFQNDGVTQIANNSFITIAQGNAGLKFTPLANSIVPGSFQVQSSRDAVGTGLSPGVATATITVIPIADTPSVTNASTNEDTQTTFGLVISRNPADGAEVTHFKVTNIQNGSLFLNDGVTSVASGSFVTFAQGNAGLRFTPATNLHNPGTTFSFDVQASTSNSNAGLGGGVVTASIAVTAVNDAPLFTKGANQTVTENAGAQTVNNWATNISAGPADESSQTLNFIVTNNNNALFSAQPAVSAAGVLTYTPAANTSGSATVSVSLHDNGGTANGGVDTSAVQTFTITVNSGGTLQFSASTYTIAENNGPAVITITRTGGSSGTATVKIDTSSGTATAGSDYTTVSQTVTFNDGDTSMTVNVPVTDDLLNEPDETVNLTLSNAGGSATLGSTITAVLTITDNDPVGGYLKFSAPNYNVNEGGVATITVQRVGTLTQAVTVDFATSDDSDPAAQLPCAPAPGNTLASSRCDFISAFGRLMWAAGDGADKTFTVMTTQDNYVEGPETLTLTLSTPTGGAVFSGPSTELLTITDDVVEPPTNSIDDTGNFVEEMYRDFLNRPSDPAGKAFWAANIDKCNDPAQRPAGMTQAQCIEFFRVTTAGAFFLSIEFQTTGGTAYLTNKAAYGGGLPTFIRFERDAQGVGQGYVFGAPGAEALLEANKVAYYNDLVTRAEFTSIYGVMTDSQYVNTLISNSGILFPATDRNALISGLSNHTETRATVLRKISEKPEFRTAEFNNMFVLMEYFGFLRRNPDPAGFNFWLNKLTENNGDYLAAEMVKAFIESTEYRNRFGP